MGLLWAFRVFSTVALIFALFFLFRIIVRSRESVKLRAQIVTENGEEERFFIDFAYPIGMLYTFLCSTIFLFNLIASFTPIDLLALLNNQKDYYYFMSALSISNAFLIVPERSAILPDYQLYFVFLTIFWLILPFSLTFF